MLNRFRSFIFLASVLSLVVSGRTYAQSSQPQTGSVSEAVTGDLLPTEIKPMSDASFLNSQPRRGWTLFEFTPTYSSSARAYSNVEGGSPVNVAINESAMALKASYGFSDTFSALVATSIGSVTKKRSTSTKTFTFDGLSDVNLGFISSTDVGAGRLFRGVKISLSPVSEIATVSRSGSRDSGGPSFQPQIAYEQQLSGAWIVGSALSYQVNGEAKSESKDRSGRVNFRENILGGNTLSFSVFTEMRLDTSAIGIVGIYNNIEGSSVSNTDESYELDPYRTIELQLYSSFKISPQFSLIPELSYSSYLTRQMNGIQYDTASVTSVFVNTRINL